MLTARWHSESTGEVAEAMTSQEFLGLARVDTRTVLFVASAQARHPDTRVLIRAAVALDLDVVLLTQRAGPELQGIKLVPRLTVLRVPQPGERDGFLASNSLLASAVVLARLYKRADLPETLLPIQIEVPAEAGKLIVLHDSATASVGRDIETRFSELGLAPVQSIDYRTLAHGRHFGLSRNAKDTAIVALLTPNSTTGRATLAALPDTLKVVEMETSDPGVGGILQLLVSAMWLPVAAANREGISVHRPGVPAYGRRLYHLTPRTQRETTLAAVRRKLAAANLGDGAARQFYSDALDQWEARHSRTKLGAIALDYDGTVVETANRFDLPSHSMQARLIEILDLGVGLGFASGRGDSLHRDLRSWLPNKYWSRVVLGLHNGSWLATLDDDFEDGEAPPELLEATARLRDLLPPGLAELRQSGRQLSVRALDSWTSSSSLLSLVQTVVSASPRLDLSSRRSGHSVDITAPEVGKASVVYKLEEEFGSTLAIGDQGDLGGNDFDLLAATTFSLSVDRCSSDPTRCWSLAPPGYRGPEALLSVLGGLRSARGAVYFRPKRYR